jgi:hypothetical protein
VATVPRNVAPAPAPATMPPASSSQKLGSQAAAVTSASPATSAARPRPACVRRVALLSTICAAAPAPNTANATAPATACESLCSTPASRLGATDVNTPNSANTTPAAVAAARNRGRCSAGTLTRCGRYAGRRGGTGAVSGATARATAPISISASDTR